MDAVVKAGVNHLGDYFKPFQLGLGLATAVQQIGKASQKVPASGLVVGESNDAPTLIAAGKKIFEVYNASNPIFGDNRVNHYGRAYANKLITKRRSRRFSSRIRRRIRRRPIVRASSRLRAARSYTRIMTKKKKRRYFRKRWSRDKPIYRNIAYRHRYVHK